MLSLPTILQAVLLVAATVSGVHGIRLQDPSASSDLQLGQHDDSHAIEDPVSLGSDLQVDLASAGRNLQGKRRHRRPARTSYAENYNEAAGNARGRSSQVNTNTGSFTFANDEKAIGAGFASTHARGGHSAHAASASGSAACVGDCD